MYHPTSRLTAIKTQVAEAAPGAVAVVPIEAEVGEDIAARVYQLTVTDH